MPDLASHSLCMQARKPRSVGWLQGRSDVAEASSCAFHEPQRFLAQRLATALLRLETVTAELAERRHGMADGANPAKTRRKASGEAG